MRFWKCWILMAILVWVASCSKPGLGEIKTPYLASISPTIISEKTVEKLSEHTTQYVTPVPCLSATLQGLPVDLAIRNSHILFQGYDPEAKHDRVWVYSVKDGSKKLVYDGGTNFGLAFLKDGYHFVFPSSVDNKVQMGNIDGNPPVLVDIDEKLLSNFIPYSPIWDILTNQANSYDYLVGRHHSPNGQVVASWKDGDPALMFEEQVGEKKTEIMKVKPGLGNFITGNWSPDGGQYAFAYNEDDVANHSYSGRLYLVNADGSGLVALTDRFEEAKIYQVKWSSDGKKIALYFYNGSSSPWPKETFGIYALGTGIIQVLSTGIPTNSSLMRQNDFIWSPDNQWIAFFGSWGQVDIRILDINTGKSYCITQDPIAEKIVDWR